jgi:hypothetical protein
MPQPNIDNEELESNAELDDVAEDTPKVRKAKLQPEWKNEPTVEMLKQDLIDADPENSTHKSNVTRWLNNMYVTGKAKTLPVTGKSSVVPKLIRKQAEWRYASLSEPFLSTEDIFNVSPTTAGDKKRAGQNELVLNQQFNTKIKKVAFIDEYVRDAVDIGTVLVEVGWLSETELVKQMQPTYDFTPEPTGQLAEQYKQFIQMQQEDPEGYMDYSTPGLDQALQSFQVDGVALFPQQTGEEEVEVEKETKNHPTVEVCDTLNIVIDPGCNGDLDKAGFIAKKFKSSLSNLKKDGRYHNLDFIDIEGASPFGQADYDEPTENGSFNFTDKPRKQFVVHSYWGYWDIHNTGKTAPIVAAWVGDTIIRMEENPFPDRKPPFVKVVYLPKRKSVYGEPDGELLEDNQKISGAIVRGMIDLMGKSANSQTGMRKDMLDVTNKRKFLRGDNYEYNANVDPRMGVYTHTFPEIPQSAYNMLTLQNNEAESLTGTKAFSSGINGQALGSSVGNARGAMDAASKREMSILRRLAEGIVEIGRKIVSMNAVFLSEEEVVRITAEDFITVRRDDLAGEFDIKLSISTPEADNEKAQELAFMLQTNGPNADPGEVRMIRAEIARLRKMPDLAKKIEEYQPQPDPLQVMKAQLEIELLKKQIAKEEALTQKHSSEASVNVAREYKEGAQGELNVAKAATEGAKTRNLHSDSDNKDLGFLEQEKGVHQARELEKIDKQQEHNMQSKAIDAHFNKQATKVKPTL